MLIQLKKCALLVTAMALAYVASSGAPARAGSCTELARLAQKSAAYYRNSGDQHHYAAARNYQNAYNGCVSATRQRTRAATGSTGYGSGGAFDITMNVLSTLNSLTRNSREQKAYERAVAEEKRKQDELVRRQEAELKRAIQAARQAQEEEQRRERERQRVARAEAAALSSRCAKKNPFGRNADACDGLHSDPSPFASSRGTTANPFARSDNAAPDWNAGRRNHSTYDSVMGIDCPEMFERGCVPDVWRQMLSRLEHDHGGNIRQALLAAYDRQQAAQSASFLYRDTLTEEQYRRLGTGDATFEDIEREISSFDFAPVTLSSLEEKLAAIENDPQTKREFERALSDIMGQ